MFCYIESKASSCSLGSFMAPLRCPGGTGLMVAPARASLVSLVASLLLACNSPAAGRMLATTSAAAARAGPPPAPLPAAPAVRRLPTGSTTPRGWLLRQLVIQAEGLSGHLTKFWPKVANSAWFGGTAPFYIANNSCGDAPCPKANNISQTDLLHQEAPYWLNGFVPLAVLLRNARIDELPPNGPGLPTIRCATKEMRLSVDRAGLPSLWCRKVD